MGMKEERTIVHQRKTERGFCKNVTQGGRHTVETGAL
jgi:hypothetical protein